MRKYTWVVRESVYVYILNILICCVEITTLQTGTQTTKRCFDLIVSDEAEYREVNQRGGT